MADAVKKVIKKIRGKHKPPEKLEPLWMKLKAEHEARLLQEAAWERDKKIVRDENFKKALIARQQQIEAINAEKQRQVEIAELRLKNLKKARRKLAKLREEQ